MAAEPARAEVAPLRPAVRCGCGHVIFDGEVIRARAVKVLARGAEAKCRCKEWVAVPVSYLMSL